jgi:acetyl esterase/lipase
VSGSSAHLGDPDTIRPSRIVYSTVRGYRPLAFDLYRAERGTRAICLYLHGGGWQVGSRAAGPGPLTPSSGRLFARMAAQGLAVASASYRLSGEARFPAQREDVMAACRHLMDNETLGLSGLPLVVWGVSAGGHLATLRALDQADPPVRAAVTWYTPTDLLAMPDDCEAAGGVPDIGEGSREGLLLGADPASVPELVHEASPINHVHPAAPPMLMVHGTKDRGVPHAQSERFVAAMLNVGGQATLRSVPDYDHMFTGMPDEQVDALVDECIAFLLLAADG